MRKSPRQRRGDTGHIAKPAPRDQGTADTQYFTSKMFKERANCKKRLAKVPYRG